MGGERHSSKGVGGFLQLFDWNSKSRKKLFSNKSDFPDQSKRGKRSDRNLPVTRYDHEDEDESRAGSSVKGSSEYSCASSVVDDDGYGGVRGPSVVARLMGLDSMPASNCSEPSSTPFFRAQSLRGSLYQRENIEIERDSQMYFSGDLTTVGQSRSTFDSKPRKMTGRPIEKFQSEVLPPRSAKSIPITQHKLLSPIKSSGMFYTGDAAHIMEAAAKIIESGSQAILKSKMPLIGSSSLPLKVRDLKEKARATQEKPEAGSSFASFRMREKERIDAVQEKESSGYSSTSFRIRDRVDSLPEKTSNGCSSVAIRMKDKERAEAIQEKTGAGYASSSFRIRNKERVDAPDERLEIRCNSGSFRAGDKERPVAPPSSSRPASASEKPVESNAARYLRGQSMNKSLNWSGDTMPFGATSDAEVSYNSNKGKSVSLAIQAKVNVQKREGSRLNSSRSLAVQKEQTEVKGNASTLKNMHKRSSMQNASGVLRQNNQRQNSTTEKDMPSKLSISNSRGKKSITVDSSSTKEKTSSKLGGSSKTRKINVEAKNNESDLLNSVKNVPRKKRNIDSGRQFEGNHIADSGLNKSQKSEANMDRNAWIEDSRKKGMDVVSFTFTSPMSRPASGFNSPSQMAQRTDGLFPNNWGKKLLLDSQCNISSAHGVNVVGSDALSHLLEQKLRELTSGIGLSSHDKMKSGSAANFETNILSQDAGSATSRLNEHAYLYTNRIGNRFDAGFQIDPLLGLSSHDKMKSGSAANFETNILSQDAGSATSRLNEHAYLYTNRIGNRFDAGFQIDPLLSRNEQKPQGADEMDACSSNHAEAKNLHDCHLPSPVSILEGSFSTESCNSSRTADSGTEDSKPCSSVQACEVIGVGSTKKFNLMEADLDLSDSASSISPGIFTGKTGTTVIAANTSQPVHKWELNYVKHILSNLNVHFDNFSVGLTPVMLNPQLFDQLENSRGWSASNSHSSKLERKLYFDCVGESLELRCRRYVGGGCEAWSKGISVVKMKERLVEEVYKEISGLRGLADCMVDELVDKDMSSQHGKWLKFEAEESSLGVEIEGQIFGSLVDELVADILLR
ncbi:unnamed protein product [Rhodiola kirilowii]